jgi:hypothetical protein
MFLDFYFSVICLKLSKVSFDSQVISNNSTHWFVSLNRVVARWKKMILANDELSRREIHAIFKMYSLSFFELSHFFCWWLDSHNLLSFCFYFVGLATVRENLTVQKTQAVLWSFILGWLSTWNSQLFLKYTMDTLVKILNYDSI